MDVAELQLDANRVVSFDGRVLEVFGGQVRRFHVRLLSVTVGKPDKRGVRSVGLRQAGSTSDVPVDEDAFARLAPVLHALRAAGVDVQSA
jgi:hypothetical protein